jgi:hypothetical protein
MVVAASYFPFLYFLFLLKPELYYTQLFLKVNKLLMFNLIPEAMVSSASEIVLIVGPVSIQGMTGLRFGVLITVIDSNSRID